MKVVVGGTIEYSLPKICMQGWLIRQPALHEYRGQALEFAMLLKYVVATYYVPNVSSEIRQNSLTTSLPDAAKPPAVEKLIVS